MNFIGPGNFGYDAALAAAGRNPADHQIASMQVSTVSDSADQAWDKAGAGIEYFVNFYNLRKNLDGSQQGNPPITQEMLRSGNAGFWRASVGTPEDVIAGLAPIAGGHLGRCHRDRLRFPSCGDAQRCGAQVDEDVSRARDAGAGGDGDELQFSATCGTGLSGAESTNE